MSEIHIMTMGVIVVDLDGTLSDHSAREHLAQQGRWDEYHARFSEDHAHEDARALVNTMHREYTTMVITGRPAVHYQKTVDWLCKHCIRTDLVLMRKNGDRRSDAEVKLDLLVSALGTLEEALEKVVFILEDRDKVVEEWRNAGFNCWQVRHGGY